MKKNNYNIIISIISIILIIFFVFLISPAIKNDEKKGYIYKENFLKQDDYSNVLNELKKYDNQLNFHKENDSNLIRYNLVIDSNTVYTNNPVTTILKKYQGEIRNIIQNQSVYLANDFPIEYRKYVPGSFMQKHKDTLIYKIPQYECVLTLSNNTDSVTMMKDTPIKATPNSLIIVRASGIEHEVTKVTKGERKFLKFIFTETDHKV